MDDGVVAGHRARGSGRSHLTTTGNWSMEGPSFLGHIISHVVLDPRDRARSWPERATGHLGPTVFRSSDMGRTWAEASKPPAFATGDPLGRSVRKVFWLTPGHVDEPGVWYAGGTPQGLFRTEDGGDTWASVGEGSE